jgi:hypothetical protein
MPALPLDERNKSQCIGYVPEIHQKFTVHATHSAASLSFSHTPILLLFFYLNRKLNNRTRPLRGIHVELITCFT